MAPSLYRNESSRSYISLHPVPPNSDSPRLVKGSEKGQDEDEKECEKQQNKDSTEEQKDQNKEKSEDQLGSTSGQRRQPRTNLRRAPSQVGMAMRIDNKTMSNKSTTMG